MNVFLYTQTQRSHFFYKSVFFGFLSRQASLLKYVCVCVCLRQWWQRAAAAMVFLYQKKSRIWWEVRMNSNAFGLALALCIERKIRSNRSNVFVHFASLILFFFFLLHTDSYEFFNIRFYLCALMRASIFNRMISPHISLITFCYCCFLLLEIMDFNRFVRFRHRSTLPRGNEGVNFNIGKRNLSPA